MVEVRDLRKQYMGRGADGHRSPVTAVDGVHLQVRPGELVVLLGPSGCGKTTLLRCIAGLEKPQEGEIRVHGRTMFSAPSKVYVPPEHRHIGMMFQSYALWPHMTVSQNVAYALPGSLDRAVRDARVNDMLDRMGVPGLGHRFPGELSGGQQQRVALARALIASQSLILFDEPLSNVDAKVRRRLRAELREVKRRNGFAGVYVTHDQEEAMELADTLVVMESGRIRQIGAPREVYERPASVYVAGFVGEINRWPAHVLHAGSQVRVSCEFAELTATALGSAAAGEKGWVGIRPEHVGITLREPGPGEANQLPATVDDVVHLGPRTECRLSMAGHPLMASLDSDRAQGLAAGQRVGVQLNPEKLRWLPA